MVAGCRVWHPAIIKYNTNKNYKTMIGTIIYIIGLVLAIKAVLEILKMPMGTAGKVISAVVVLCTSWVGLAVYYFYAKDKLVSWFE